MLGSVGECVNLSKCCSTGGAGPATPPRSDAASSVSQTGQHCGATLSRHAKGMQVLVSVLSKEMCLSSGV